jgi:hypothetical protein
VSLDADYNRSLICLLASESSHVAGQGEVIIRTGQGSQDTSLLLIVPLAHVTRRATRDPRPAQPCIIIGSQAAEVQAVH